MAFHHAVYQPASYATHDPTPAFHHFRFAESISLTIVVELEIS
jgi:hypothetical protein